MNFRVSGISAVICICLVLLTSQAFSQKTEVVLKESMVTLDLRDRPLKSVAEEIFKQTGCKVVFDEKWNELPLSGQYTAVSLEEFFRRTLRKQNFSLTFDEKSKVAILRFYGDRGIGKTNIDTIANSNAAAVNAIENIKALHEEQRQELQAYLKDPDAVDPVSGMKLVDIQKLQSTQQAESKNLQEDPETIDPVSGMTNAEIKNLHEAQQAESEQSQEKVSK